MQKIVTFLTFATSPVAPVELYVSLFPGARIVSTMPGPGPEPMGITFELAGQTYIALHGGPTFSFAEGMSLFVSCDDQAEIDRLWGALTTNGGKESQCGWLVDPWGVSWQIVPRRLGELLGHTDREKAGRAMQAMLGMKKLDIAALERAFEGK